MDISKLLKICIIFLAGFFIANVINFYLVYGLENPFSGGIIGIDNNSKQAPHDTINEDNIEIQKDRIIIHVANASIGRYAPTGSMKPVFDENSNGIRIVPKSEDEINIGDIITFNDQDTLIIHRVIQKGKDSEGTYFITKGDNNSLNDGKIRFKDVRYKTIGILW